MASVNLTQETVLKHFMERSAEIPADDATWQVRAIQNHIERGGTGTALASMNTLLLVKPTIWPGIVEGSYFGNHLPPVAGGQLALTVDREDIDRIITTRKKADLDLAVLDVEDLINNYEIVDDLQDDRVVDVTFLCQYDAATNLYTITHLEGLGQFQ